MLTQDEVERYSDIQKDGLPIGKELITIAKAAELVGKTFMAVSLVKAKNPGENVKGKITWWVVGSQIMLDKPSLIAIAIKRGWIEEV